MKQYSDLLNRPQVIVSTQLGGKKFTVKILAIDVGTGMILVSTRTTDASFKDSWIHVSSLIIEDEDEDEELEV